MFGRILKLVIKNRHHSYLRKLSNAPGAAHEKTTEEKAAEVSIYIQIFIYLTLLQLVNLICLIVKLNIFSITRWVKNRGLH